MHIRDGMPVITGEDDATHIKKGDKIFFNDNYREAYEAISSIQPGNIYKWNTVDIDREPFNVLITDNIGGTFVNVDKEGKYIDEFDGYDGPFCSNVVHRGKEKENNIEALEDSLNDILDIFDKMIEITFKRQ